MKLKEFIICADGDYEDVLLRLGNETLIVNFLKQFQNDTSYYDLKQALINKNYEEAYIFAHNIKGITDSLGLKKLMQIANEILEQIKSKKYEKIDYLFNQFESNYFLVVELIKKL